MSSNSRERILSAAKTMAQAHGYNGLSVRDLAEEVGIKAASIYHHFPSKADLAAAVAKRYWEDTAGWLDATLAENIDNPQRALDRFPETFRWALENGNRMCLCSFMGAEFDDLPDALKKEVQTFADINVAWLRKVLLAVGLKNPEKSADRAHAIFASVVGAQLLARSRSDIKVFDSLIKAYRETGLLPQ